jgi:hypothetical protein
MEALPCHRLVLYEVKWNESFDMVGHGWIFAVDFCSSNWSGGHFLGADLIKQLPQRASRKHSLEWTCRVWNPETNAKIHDILMILALYPIFPICYYMLLQ